ncbi:PIG-L deacetylase family protein [Pseudomonas guariconensis]|uniref:PIG-L deacetylase family protein n=1 Tax=Pseudomonas guariconensis TaxID=1288410 RepID=UPI0018D8BC7B|nr:PIG-L deacetylase family protein [Pseudomonas guariconensis]MBH3359064.1 PIG-L family deacetylase [Pseudomonas guariconensis]MDM9595248.1 PIG-L deacetylase family protein [Pseudomonas guariconensis]MDM9608077.1 PIG-L deacetylase family protein [Pseudomonas guariconensis]MDM9613034.1 PIG-L deacetylase family protein [Pseudomonas guariconensis]
MGEHVLVVVAHSDDEALGCGATIAKHARAGDMVDIVFVADGVSSRDSGDDAALERRVSAAEKATQILGVRRLHYLNFPDNQLDSVPLISITKEIEGILSQTPATVVYTHHYGDLNVDHRVVHQAVMTAIRPMPGQTVKTILTFEVLSSTEWASPGLMPFLPNYFVDTTDYIEYKMRALQCYSEEIREFPHSRSYENVHALSRYRGACNGFSEAEAFMLMRMLR